MKINRKILLFSVTVLSAICFILGIVFLPKPTKYVAQADAAALEAEFTNNGQFTASQGNMAKSTLTFIDGTSVGGTGAVLQIDGSGWHDVRVDFSASNILAANVVGIVVRVKVATPGANDQFRTSNGSGWVSLYCTPTDFSTWQDVKLDAATMTALTQGSGMLGAIEFIVNTSSGAVYIDSITVTSSLDFTGGQFTVSSSSVGGNTFSFIDGTTVGGEGAVLQVDRSSYNGVHIDFSASNILASEVASIVVRLKVSNFTSGNDEFRAHNGSVWVSLYGTGYDLSDWTDITLNSATMAALTSNGKLGAIDLVVKTGNASAKVYIDSITVKSVYEPTFTTIRAGYNNSTNGSDGWLFATFDTTALGNQISIPAADYTGINYNGQHASNFLKALNNFNNSDLWFIYQEQSTNDKLVAWYNGYSHPTIEIEEGATVVYGGHTFTFHAVTFYFNFTTNQWQTTMPDGYVDHDIATFSSVWDAADAYNSQSQVLLRYTSHTNWDHTDKGNLASKITLTNSSTSVTTTMSADNMAGWENQKWIILSGLTDYDTIEIASGGTFGGDVEIPALTLYKVNGRWTSVAPHAATATYSNMAGGWNNNVSGTNSTNILCYNVNPLGDAANATNLAATVNRTSLMVKYNGTTFADLYGTNNAYTISYAHGNLYFYFVVPTADLFDGAVFEIEEGTPFMNYYLNGLKLEYDAVLNAWEPYVERVYGTPTYSVPTDAQVGTSGWDHNTENLAANASSDYGYTGIGGWNAAVSSTNLAATRSLLSLSVKLNGVSFYHIYKNDNNYRISTIIGLFGFSVKTADLTVAAATAAGYDYPTIEVVEGTPFNGGYLPALTIVFIDGAWQLPPIPSDNYEPNFLNIAHQNISNPNPNITGLALTFDTDVFEAAATQISASNVTGITFNGKTPAEAGMSVVLWEGDKILFWYDNTKAIFRYNDYSHPTIAIAEGATLTNSSEKVFTFSGVTVYLDNGTWSTTMPNGYFAGLPTYDDSELADYDVITTVQLGKGDGLTVNSQTITSAYTCSAANTTKSVVFKFTMTQNGTGGERFVILRSNGGANGYRFVLDTLRIATVSSWTPTTVAEPYGTISQGVEYGVELGAIDLADESGVWLYIKIDGVLIQSVVADAVGGNTNHVSIYTSSASGYTVGLPSDYLAVYDTVSVNDVFGTGEKVITNGTDAGFTYTKSASNTTSSVVLKFKLTVGSLVNCNRLITLRFSNWAGYRFMLAQNGTGVAIAYFTGSAFVNLSSNVTYNTSGTVPATFDVELGAINLADGGVWQYAKIDGVYLVSVVHSESDVVSADTNTVKVFSTDEVDWTISDVDLRILTIRYNGETVVSGNAVWTESGLSSFFDESAVSDEQNVFIGFEYDGNLYRSLYDINKPETSITVDAITLNFYMENGAYLRLISDSSGLRFIATIIPNEYVSNYSILFTETETARGGFDLDALEGKKYLEIGTKSVGFKEKNNGDGSKSFAVVMTGLTAEQYGLSFSVRGCVEIEYAGGSTAYCYTHYSEANNARSLTNVAKAALNIDRSSFTDDEKVILFGYAGESFGQSAHIPPTSGITYNKAGNSEWDYIGMATVADMKEYFDAGFEYYMGSDWVYGNKRLYNDFGQSKNIDDAYYLLDLAAEYCATYNKTAKDCKILIQINYFTALQSATNEPYSLVDITDGSAKTTWNDTPNSQHTSADFWKGILREAVNNLKNYVPTNGGINCFAGLVTHDEPQGSMLDTFTYWYNFVAGEDYYEGGVEKHDGLNLLDEGYYIDICLPGQMLAGVAPNNLKVNGYNYTGVAESAYYGIYLDAFINGIHPDLRDKTFVGNDNYQIYTIAQRKANKATKNYGNYFYSNMQMYAEAAKSSGIKTGLVLQSYAAYNTSHISTSQSADYPYLGILDHQGYITLQAYAAMAYGFDAISYFTYCEHWLYDSSNPYFDAPYLYNESTGVWEKQAMYTYVQNANALIDKLQPIYTGFDWQGTKLVAGSSATKGFGNATNYTAYSGVLSSITATQDAVAGCFTLGDDYEGFMVANTALPTDTLSGTKYYTGHIPSNNTVAMTFAGCTKAIVYLNGTPEIQNLTNGVLSLNLAFGEGAFVIPLP